MKPCSPLWPGRLGALVDPGASAILVGHDMKVAAAGDRVIDIGPGAGADSGRIVASGPQRKSPPAG